MKLFDNFARRSIYIPWKSGLGGLTSLAAGCEDYRRHVSHREYVRCFYYGVHCVLGGKGRLILRGKRYDIGPGDMFCVPPRERLLYESDEEDPWQYCWFSFAGEQAPVYAAALGFTPDASPVRPMKDQAGVEAIMASLLAEMDTPDSTSAVMESNPFVYGLLMSFFAFMKQESCDVTTDSTLLQERDTARLESFIHEHYQDQNFAFSDDFLPFHMTSGLRANFHRQYGVSPMKYLIALRMEHAAVLLARGSKKLSVSEIASLCGYRDVYHFMRVFKKAYGTSAVKYRNYHNKR